MVKEKIKTSTAKNRKVKKVNYLFAVGRRRTAVARVRLYQRQKGEMLVNGLAIDKYFPGVLAKKVYLEPLRICNLIDKYLITFKVLGSGKVGQLGAVIHALTRVLVKLNPEKFRPILKKRGFLTRDSRMRERRKVGMGGKSRRKRQSPRR